jgi:hypothetical protein
MQDLAPSILSRLEHQVCQVDDALAYGRTRAFPFGKLSAALGLARMRARPVPRSWLLSRHRDAERGIRTIAFFSDRNIHI